MWGSLSGTIGRVSHSLISHTKGARSTREVEGQQRLAALPYELYLDCMASAGTLAPNLFQQSCK